MQSNVVTGHFICILTILFEVVGAAHVFDVYRAIQLDSKTGQHGSRKSYLSAAASVFEPNEADESAHPVRQALIVRLEELGVSTIEALLSGTTAGILILLPSQLGEPGFVAENTLEVMRLLEEKILAGSFDIPIYFAVEDDKLGKTYDSLKRRMQSRLSTADDYSMVVTEKEAEPINKVNVVSYQGTLLGTNDGIGEDERAIVVVAHYDTLGSVPGFTKGTNHNGSGTTALLEIARLFSKLYSASQTRGGHNILFVLSGGGRMNYYGTRQWLQNTPSSVLDFVDFAICLESIGSENLYLHVSKKPKEDHIKQLYSNFISTAAKFGVNMSLVHKKINVSHHEMGWEHEAFAYKKIIAATISDNPLPTPQLTRSSALDVHVNQDIIEKNIEMISTVICDYIYRADKRNAQGGGGHGATENDRPSTSIFRGGLAVNSRYVGSVLQYLSKHPRSTPHLQPNNEIFGTLHKMLQAHVSDVQEKKHELKSEQKFYNKIQAEMYIHTTKPLLFDLILMIPIAIYILALNMYFKGFETINEYTSQVGINLPVGTHAKSRR